MAEKDLYKQIAPTSVGHKLIRDRRFRAVFFTGASLVWNLVYSLWNGILGVIYASSWFGVLCVYYFVLGAMRFSALPLGRPQKRKGNEKGMLCFNGLVLILLAVVLSVSVSISISDSHRKSYPMIVMIGIAAYTFYIAVLAVVNTVKAHKEKSVFMMIIRNISLAAAIASMLSLQRSMIATFSPADTSFAFTLNVCTGAGGFILITALGISMIAATKKKSE